MVLQAGIIPDFPVNLLTTITGPDNYEILASRNYGLRNDRMVFNKDLLWPVLSK
jgi:hypothetical protein